MESDYDAILGSVENSDLSQAAAFSVVIIIFILLALWLIQFLVNRLEEEESSNLKRQNLCNPYESSKGVVSE